VDFSWTLVFEVYFYLVLAALLLFTVRRAVVAMIAGFTAMVCLSGVVDIAQERWALIANPILLEFVYGAVLALLFLRFGRRRPLGIVLLVVGSAAALWIRHSPPDAANGMAQILDGGRVLMRSLTWGLAAAAIIAGVIFWSPEVRGRVGKLALVIGNASYSVYLGSALVIEFGARALGALHPVRASESPAMIGLYDTSLVLIVLLSGWLSYQFVEWPMVRQLQKRFAERRSPAEPRPHLAQAAK
jgi:peptidoglycan/LPS O-acetylase OafA/YrhL